ncbi:hypothetical protein ABVT39_001693 [Epinephelus coioides]
MSQTSEQTQCIAAATEQTAEPEQTYESSTAQEEVQSGEPCKVGPRRSERSQTLTEKGKELQKEKIQGLLLRFDSIYERWKALTKVAKKSVIKQDPSDILQEHISTIQKELSELNSVYDEYRRIDSPSHDMLRKLDKCTSVTSLVVKNAQSQIQVQN